MKTDNYGLNPNQLASLNRLAKVSKHSILFFCESDLSVKAADMMLTKLDTTKTVMVLLRQPDGSGYRLVKHKNCPSPETVVEKFNNPNFRKYAKQKK